MLSGVSALVLAVATAALPFTAPPGWVQLPASAVHTEVGNVWQSPPLKSGKHATFSTLTMPFPGSVDALSTVLKAHRHAGPVQVVTNVPVTLCGVSGRAITLKTGSGANAVVIQQELIAKDGRGYMAVYGRPATAPADPHVLAVMKQLCPGAGGTIPKLTPPHGWTANENVSMQMIGMWMGTHPGEMMMLMRTDAAVPLAKIAGELHGNMNTGASKYLQVVSQKTLRLCGNPALDVAMQLNIPNFPMAMEQIATQAGGKTYMLSYLHPTSVAADPAAQASLQSLCASGAPQPNPSASPAPLPSSSPMPSSTPSATATPVRF